MTRVTLYSKPECHVCDLVKEVIARVQKHREFELEIRNILDDPADFEKFKSEIPVVCVNGNEIARFRLSEERLKYALEAVVESNPGKTDNN
jgi:glutaredoxin